MDFNLNFDWLEIKMRIRMVCLSIVAILSLVLLLGCHSDDSDGNNRRRATVSLSSDTIEAGDIATITIRLGDVTNAAMATSIFATEALTAAAFDEPAVFQVTTAANVNFSPRDTCTIFGGEGVCEITMSAGFLNVIGEHTLTVTDVSPSGNIFIINPAVPFTVQPRNSSNVYVGSRASAPQPITH